MPYVNLRRLHSTWSHEAEIASACPDSVDLRMLRFCLRTHIHASTAQTVESHHLKLRSKSGFGDMSEGLV